MSESVQLTVLPYAARPVLTITEFGEFWRISWPTWHPEWEHGDTHRMIGVHDEKLVIYDTDAMELVGQIGTPEIIKGPGGDTALSPDGNWTVTGYKIDGHYNE